MGFHRLRGLPGRAIRHGPGPWPSLLLPGAQPLAHPLLRFEVKLEVELTPPWCCVPHGGPGGTGLGVHRPGKAPAGPSTGCPPGGRGRLVSVTGFSFSGAHQAGSSVLTEGAREGADARVCGPLLVPALAPGRLNPMRSSLDDRVAGSLSPAHPLPLLWDLACSAEGYSSLCLSGPFKNGLPCTPCQGWIRGENRVIRKNTSWFLSHTKP